MSDRYQIKEKLAQGGVGAVYRAHDKSLDREVAIKRLLPQTEDATQAIVSKEELLQEAKTLSALQHPHIVTVYDTGQDSEGPFVVMELLTGETLDQVIERSALTEEDFKEVVRQTLKAMIAAQKQGLLHRDIKPSNFMLSWLDDGKFHVKILDFGLARFRKKPSVQTSDHGESILGSIYFMSPEQFERGELDGRSDLYSLGALYYYCLTGRNPYTGDSAAQVMNSHLEHRYTSLAKLRPDLPEWLPKWIDWMMSRQAEDRPLDAREAYEQFKKQSYQPDSEYRQAQAEQKEKEAAAQEAKIAAEKKKAEAPLAIIVEDDNTPASSPKAASALGEAPTLQAAENREGEAVLLDEEDKGVTKSVLSGVPKWVWWGVGSLLLLSSFFAGKNYLVGRGQEQAKSSFDQLINSENPSGTSKDVEFLAGYILKNPEGGQAVEAAQTLTRLNGPGVPEAIISAARESQSVTARKQLIKVLQLREEPKAVPYLLETSKKSSGSLRLAAIDALGWATEPKDLGKVVALLDQFEAPDEIDYAQNSLINITDKMPNEAAKSEAILNALNSVNQDRSRRALLSVAAHLGSEQAFTRLRSLLGDKKMAMHAAAALGEYPDNRPLASLLNYLNSESEATSKLVGIQSMVQLANRPSDKPHHHNIDLLRQAAAHSSRDRELLQIANSIAQLPDPKAEEAITALLSEDRHQRLLPEVLKMQTAVQDKLIDLSSNNNLSASSAVITGPGAKYNKDLDLINEWIGEDAWLIWNLQISEAGNYRVIVEQNCSSELNPGDYRIQAGGTTLQVEVIKTAAEDFARVEAGNLQFSEAGTYSFWLIPGRFNKELMSLKQITLEKQ